VASGIVHTGLFSRRDCSSKRERVQRRSGQRGRWAFVVGLLVEEGASPKECQRRRWAFIVGLLFAEGASPRNASVVAGLYMIGLLFAEGASPKGMASVVAGLYRRRTTDELLRASTSSPKDRRKGTLFLLLLLLTPQGKEVESATSFPERFSLRDPYYIIYKRKKRLITVTKRNRCF
jgi:hypothetical protein